MECGATLVVETVQAISQGDFPQRDQEFTDDLPVAPKIFKETTEINWENTAPQLHNFIRGLSPYPAAWTLLFGKMVKIFQTLPVQEIPDQLSPLEDGNKTWYTDHKKLLYVSTARGFLHILSLQIEGKKRMGTEEFLRGYRF
jgi:methionyl-tRNA formyltransferase